MPMKKSTDTIGDRTPAFPVCSAVPQPTAPLRAPGFLTQVFVKKREKERHTFQHTGVNGKIILKLIFKK
jgi:hypothetical protein